MVTILNSNSYTTHVVDSCADVLDQLLKKDYDVVIVDSNLKEMTSLDIVEFVKRFHGRRETVVVLASDTSPETSERIAEIGPYYTLEKPLSRERTRLLVKSFEKRLNQLEVANVTIVDRIQQS